VPSFRSLLIWVLATASLSPSWAAAQGKPLWDAIRESGTLTCGAMEAYPIVSYAVPSSRRYEGYSPAFCRAIAHDLSSAMGKTIEVAWQPTSWATVVLDLQSARMDLFAGMSVTQERLKALDMAGPLYELADCMIYRRGTTGRASWADYDDPAARIAVVAGTSEEKATRELAPKAEILAFKEVSAAILSIQAGRADALPLAITSCLNTMKITSGIFGGYVVPRPVHATDSAAGMRKDGDGRFAAWLQKWAVDARSSGRVRELFIEQMGLAGFDLSNLPAGLKF
jgi:polar amino acid transport system substrate-binding protein